MCCIRASGSFPKSHLTVSFAGRSTVELQQTVERRVGMGAEMIRMKSISTFAVALLCICWAISIRADDTKPPEGAKILFDGHDKSQWVHRADGRPCEWRVLDDGSMEVFHGDIVTKEKFQDFKLPLEFWVPNAPPEKSGQER